MAIALDIETTGVNINEDTITCIALVSKEWQTCWHMGPGYDHEGKRKTLQDCLNNAETIIVYNGALFDIPFIQKFYNFTDKQVGQWMMKLMDPFFSARVLLGRGACPKLSQVLSLNGINPKTSSGLEAVNMAKEGRWEELADYCLNDTKVTHDLQYNRTVLRWVCGVAFEPHSVCQWKLL